MPDSGGPHPPPSPEAKDALIITYLCENPTMAVLAVASPSHCS